MDLHARAANPIDLRFTKTRSISCGDAALPYAEKSENSQFNYRQLVKIGGEQ